MTGIDFDESVSDQIDAMTSEPKRILVTGGTGLVGSAIKHVVETESDRAERNEQYFFISSRECDLKCGTSDVH